MPPFWKRNGNRGEGLRRGKFVAVDFDSWHLRIVQAEATADGIRVLKLAAADMPESLDTGEAQSVGSFLGRALREARVGTSGIVMNVPRSQAILKPLQLPPAPSEGELAGMVLFQMEKELPFPVAESAVDFAIERHYDAESHPEGEAQSVHVLVAAVRREVVEHYRQIAAAAGVKLHRLGLRPYADVRAVQAYSRLADRDSVFVLHVTADEIEINILAGSSLAFSRSAGIKLLVEESAEATAAAEAPDERLADPVHKIVMEVARSLRSYQSVEPAKAVQTAVVAGGTGVEDRLAEELERHLGLECIVFDPGRALSLPEGGGRDAGAFISALGLAVGHEQTGSLPYDFVNPKRPPVRRNRTRQIATGVAAAALAVVLATVAGAGVYLHGKSKRMDELNRRLKELQPANKQVKDLEKRVLEIEQWQEAARPWLDHWAKLHAVFPPCTELYTTKLEVPADGSLQLAVQATETAVIDDLGRRLSEAGYSYKPAPINTVKNDPRYQISTKVGVLIGPDQEVDLTDLSPEPRPPDDVSLELLAAGKDWRREETAGMTVVRETPDQPQPTVVSSQPESRDLARLVLEAFDRDKNGKLSYREAYNAKREIYRRPAPPWDTDGDRRIGPDEYRRLKDVIATIQE